MDFIHLEMKKTILMQIKVKIEIICLIIILIEQVIEHLKKEIIIIKKVRICKLLFKMINKLMKKMIIIKV